MKYVIAIIGFVCLIGVAFCSYAQDTMEDSDTLAPVVKEAPAKSKSPKSPIPQAGTAEEKDLPPPLPPGTMEEMPYVELQALDKITARVSSLNAKIDDTVTFGSLNIIVKTCRKAPPEDPPESAAFLQIWEQKPGEESHWVYSGWMFASSPALAAMDHPVYDIWLINCKSSSTSSSSPASK